MQGWLTLGLMIVTQGGNPAVWGLSGIEPLLLLTGTHQPQQAAFVAVCWADMA